MANKKIFLYVLIIGFIPALFGSSARASRVVVSPPYMRRIIFTYQKSDGSAGYPDGTPIGMQMSVQVTLNNLSSVPQTGTLLMTGYAVGPEVGRTTTASLHFVTCGGGSGVGSDGSPSTTPVAFSIPANGQTVLGVGVLLYSKYEQSTDTGMVQMDSQFNPTLRITINEDRGAVNATMVPEWDTGAAGGVASMCDGFSLNPYFYALDISESRTGVPLLINGGRPF